MSALHGLLCCLAGIFCVAPAAAWTVTPRGSLVLNAGAVAGVTELSGLAYVGPVAENLHRFLAIQDSGNQLVTVDVALNTDGSLASATADSKTILSPGFDFEGIAFNDAERNSAYLSEETTPGVREYDLATGNQIASLPLPSVFAHRRANRGLESLARNAITGVIWTANEEALTIDGATATTTQGTSVRLQQFVESESGIEATAQYVYPVDPIHGGMIVDSRTRSGLSDLVFLPDGSLLALERSLAAVGQFGMTTIYQYQNRIYQIDFTGATDVSDGLYDAGLIGQSFLPITKTLLWSGQAGVGLGLGENMEGLALGPQLSNGSWSLLGVVDDGGSADVLSDNTVVAFELTLPSCQAAGDYNCSGAIDEADYLLWANLHGSVGQSPADGNGDGSVDAADYTVWRDRRSMTNASLITVAEPGAVWFAICAIPASIAFVRRGDRCK